MLFAQQKKQQQWHKENEREMDRVCFNLTSSFFSRIQVRRFSFWSSARWEYTSIFKKKRTQAFFCTLTVHFWDFSRYSPQAMLCILLYMLFFSSSFSFHIFFLQKYTQSLANICRIWVQCTIIIMNFINTKIRYVKTELNWTEQNRTQQ